MNARPRCKYTRGTIILHRKLEMGRWYKKGGYIKFSCSPVKSLKTINMLSLTFSSRFCVSVVSCSINFSDTVIQLEGET